MWNRVCRLAQSWNAKSSTNINLGISKWGILTGAITAMCVCGCKNSPQVAMSMAANSTVFPTYYGIGTILLTNNLNELPLVLERMPTPPPLILETPIGTVNGSNWDYVKIDAAAELLQWLGLTAEVTSQKYKKATISASAIKKRTLLWAHLSQAFLADTNLIRYFRNTNLSIVNDDTVVSGLNIEIAASDLSEGSLGLLMQHETAKTGAAAVTRSGSFFTLTCKDDIITGAHTRNIADTLREFQIDLGTMPTNTVTTHPPHKHVTLTLSAYGDRRKGNATIRWGYPVYSKHEYFKEMTVRCGNTATQDFYVSESDTEFEMQTEGGAPTGYLLSVEVDGKPAMLCKFNVNHSTQFTNKGGVKTIISGSFNGSGEGRIRVLFNATPNPGPIR
jgi:hypothetical protein